MAAEQNPNLYHPEDSADSPAAARKPASVSWTASEYAEHQRGFGWYLGLIIITAALAAGAYLLLHDYFATGIVIVLAIIVIFYAGHPPRSMQYELDGNGIKVGDKPYGYSLFRSFSILREGDLSTITFYPIKRLALPLAIFFDSKDEKRITELIGDYLPLEERGPDRFDRLARRLKI